MITQSAESESSRFDITVAFKSNILIILFVVLAVGVEVE